MYALEIYYFTNIFLKFGQRSPLKLFSVIYTQDQFAPVAKSMLFDALLNLLVARQK